MADYSTKSTSLQDPSLQAASHITPGVVNQSGAIATKGMSDILTQKGGVMENVADAYKGYQIGQMNDQTQQVIQQYMDSRDNLNTAKTALTDAAAQDISSSLFKPQGENLSAVEVAQRSRLNTYQQALKEGVMTPEEFSDRVTANLRELTNRNPGLFQELKQEAGRVLELSGITGIMKSDQLIAQSQQKQAEKLMTDMQERAKREHIYYDYTTSYTQLASQVQQAEGDTHMYDMQVRNKERFSMLSAEQARNWTQDVGDSVVRGSLSETNKLLLTMADTQGVTAETYPKFKAQFEAQLDNMQQLFVGSIPVSIRQDPNVQELIKSHASGLDSIKKRLEGLASGDDLKKVIGNQVEILKGAQDKRLRQTVDVASLEMGVKLATANPEIITKSPAFRENFFNASVAISQGNFTSPALNAIIPKSDKDTTSASIIKSSLDVSKQGNDYTTFNKTMEALNGQVTGIDNPKTKLQFLSNNLTAIGNQKDMKLDSVGVHHVDTTIGLLLNDPKFGVGTLIDTSKGKKVTMDITPGGQILFVGPDALPFNKAYSANINTSLQAYANARGVTTKEAAKTFYPQFLGSVIKTQQAAGGK